MTYDRTQSAEVRSDIGFGVEKRSVHDRRSYGNCIVWIVVCVHFIGCHYGTCHIELRTDIPNVVIIGALPYGMERLRIAFFYQFRTCRVGFGYCRIGQDKSHIIEFFE